HESKFIHDVVEEISMRLLNRTYLNVAKYPVGIESLVQEMDKLLDVGRNIVRMVGIWGTGGIGKTTLAKAVYNSISYKFEGSCFLANVRETTMRHGGVVQLQNVLLSEVIGGTELKVTNVDKGMNVIKQRLSHKRVLLILDDVNHLDQLNKLAGGSDWFGLGSRIIITTRDKHLLVAHQVNHIYKVTELDHHEASKLFTWNAFRDRRLDDNYVKLVMSVVQYAHGLPLALIVLGSLLCGRSIHQWQAALDNYRRVPNQEIQEILKVSYYALEDPVKEIFLDIACFYKGENKDYVMRILECCELNPKYGIEVLIEKALINIEGDHIGMHDLLEEMGKEIVRQESPTEPGNRSRLWFHEDIYHVLTENTGTSKIKGIVVKLPESYEICLNAQSFSQMKNLQVFINCNARFSGDIDYLPNELRFLDWPECPCQSLPSNFNPRKLVQLNMPRSGLLRLGEGFKSSQHLKSINFESCKFLTKIPNFSRIPNLEELNLKYCGSLVEVDPSVGFLDKLVHLRLNGCYNLRVFPRRMNLKSLRRMNLEGCTRLENFPEIEGNMKSLIWMDLSRTAIKQLPSSIGNLIGLEKLYIHGCENLTSLPCSIYRLQHLKMVSIYQCQKLVTFPNKVNPEPSCSAEALSLVLPTKSSNISRGKNGSLAFPKLWKFDVGRCNLSESNFLQTLDCGSTLEVLDLSGSDFVNLPLCIRKFVNLRMLNLRGCKRLGEIPQLPSGIERVDATDCISLEEFSNLSNILEGRDSHMIGWMNLTNCRRLCDNLAGVAKMKKIVLCPVVLSSLFLAQQSVVEVVFPGSEVPKWFSCCRDLKERRECEVSVEVPPNFKWSKTGLALCAAVEIKQHSFGNCGLIARVYMDEECSHEHVVYFDSKEMESAHLWLYYIPFHTMIAKTRSGSPPYKCQ
ncbi:TMV resistance protein N-like, partial [Prunus avium]|uniref:TMV resistance protein N-like n=1 Tax=Prunus avium TaxID=42229 RepID=A0A6P5R5X0_PRUAV